MEVGQAVLALNLINAELDLAECLLLILVKVSERDFNDTTLKRIVCIFFVIRVWSLVKLMSCGISDYSLNP